LILLHLGRIDLSPHLTPAARIGAHPSVWLASGSQLAIGEGLHVLNGTASGFLTGVKAQHVFTTADVAGRIVPNNFL
jgi:hypothetical protein